MTKTNLIFLVVLAFALLIVANAKEITVPDIVCNPQTNNDCCNSPAPLPQCHGVICKDNYLILAEKVCKEKNWMLCNHIKTNHSCNTNNETNITNLPNTTPIMPQQPTNSSQTQIPNIPSNSNLQPNIIDIYNNIHCYSNSINPCCAASVRIGNIWKNEYSLCPNITCNDLGDYSQICFEKCPKIYIEGSVYINETFTKCIPLIVDKNQSLTVFQWIENRSINVNISTTDTSITNTNISKKEDTLLRDVIISAIVLLISVFVLLKIFGSKKPSQNNDNPF